MTTFTRPRVKIMGMKPIGGTEGKSDAPVTTDSTTRKKPVLKNLPVVQNAP